MSRQKNRILFSQLFLFFIVICYYMVSNRFNLITYSILLFISFLLTFCLLGYNKRNKVNSKDKLMIILIGVGLYYIFHYLIGFFVGFTKTLYSTSFSGITYNLLFNFIVYLEIELMRYIYIRKSEYSSGIFLYSTTIVLSIVEMIMIMPFSKSSIDGSIVIISLNFFKVLIKNSLLTYIINCSSLTNSIIYRILMDLVKYVLPIFPDFSISIYYLLEIISPLLIFYKLYKYDHRVVNNNLDSSIISRIITGLLIIIFIIIILFFSGIFRFKAYIIVSDSMKSIINRGDVVIVDKNYDELKNNDIIAFKHDDRVIVHRIVDIYDQYIITKGDNNSDVDNFVVKSDEVIGIYKFRIPYLGIFRTMFN